MTRTLVRLVTCVAVLSLCALPAVAEEGGTPHEALIKAKADTVVALKFVLKVEISMGGQTQNREVNGDAMGVLVDSSGLIMTDASNFDPRLGIGRRMRRQIQVTAVPTNLRVIFPGEDKEHPAILGAKDSKLGLAFVLIKDLGEKKVTMLDIETTAEPKIGESLYAVMRLDQGFDYAPMCAQARVIGKVSKPRDMWTLAGGAGMIGHPLYTASGAVAGICVRQEGVGEDSETRPFVLPLKIAAATVRMAKKESGNALEEILEAEEEAAAEAAEEAAEAAETDEGGDADEGGGDGKKDDGGKKDDDAGKKDDGGGKKDGE